MERAGGGQGQAGFEPLPRWVVVGGELRMCLRAEGYIATDDH